MTHKTWEGRWTAPGWLYLATSDKGATVDRFMIKIGITNNVDRRLNELRRDWYGGQDDWGMYDYWYDEQPALFENKMKLKLKLYAIGREVFLVPDDHETIRVTIEKTMAPVLKLRQRWAQRKVAP